MHKSGTIILVHFDNRHSLKYEYNNKCKETKQSFERRNIMSTLELLQLQNEHKDNFFEKGEDFVYESNETQEKKGE